MKKLPRDRESQSNGAPVREVDEPRGRVVQVLEPIEAVLTATDEVPGNLEALFCKPPYDHQVVIDLLNKKGIRLLYPLKRTPCFNMCYADRLGNEALLIAGVCAIASYVMLVVAIT